MFKKFSAVFAVLCMILALVGCGGGGSSSSGSTTAPSIVDVPAITEVTSTTATIPVTVNAGTLGSANVQLTYRIGSGPVIETLSENVVGAGDHTIDFDLVGLTAGITYSFTVTVSNGIDSPKEYSGTFETDPASATAPSIVLANYYGVTTTAVTVEVLVNAGTTGSATVSLTGTGFTATPQAITGVGNQYVSFVLTGLAANTSFPYTVAVVNGLSEVDTQDGTFRTTSTGPRIVSAEDPVVTSTTATLVFTVNPGTAAGVTARVGYAIGEADIHTYTLSQNVIGNFDQPKTFTLIGLTPGTTYRYVFTIESVPLDRVTYVGYFTTPI